jgi:cytidine deaminase
VADNAKATYHAALMTPAEWTTLIQAATTVRNMAHAPYSKFQVGAALWCSDGTIVTGCNIENATYGLTVCAERNAMAQAVATQKKPIALAVVTGADAPTPPCGACRQVLAEFCSPQLDIVSATLQGGEARYTLSSLLPFAFTADNMGR